MLNRVLDGSRAASPAVLAMVDNAHAALPQLNAALRHGQRISVDLQAMQAIADRVGAGEETYYVPLPGAAASVAAESNADAEDEISRILEAEAAGPEAGETAEAEAIGTPANIDSVLREILEAEVEVHQATLQDWLRSAQQAPQPVSDALLRAVHTMNGAFAMTEVPEITAVTGGAESYIKRALAAEVVPGEDAVAALDATAQAITATMEALQAEQPRIAPQQVLAQRLQALAELPEARWPMVGLEADDDELALEDGPAAESEADASAPVDVETDALSLSPAEPAPERDAPADAGATAVADAAVEAGLEVGELTASDDPSRYFDAEWPSAPGEGELGLPGVNRSRSRRWHRKPRRIRSRRRPSACRRCPTRRADRRRRSVALPGRQCAAGRRPRCGRRSDDCRIRRPRPEWGSAGACRPRRRGGVRDACCTATRQRAVEPAG